MRILVLGGTGMLGHKMFQALRTRGADVACTISGSPGSPPVSEIPMFHDGHVLENVNALRFDELARRLDELKPHVIVNCIGVIKQRHDAISPIPSISINSLMPHKLVEVAGAWDGRVIHFSTDCVFSGEKGAYTETDTSDARDLYGRTKYLGEISGPGALTLRTSIIGRELSNFASLLEWFLAQDGKAVRGFTKAIYSGVTTNYLSELVVRLIFDFPTLCGLYQVTSPAISKYDLLHMIRDRYGLDIRITADDSEVCDRSLNGAKFRNETGIAEPTWEELIDHMASDPTPYAEWRGGAGE